MSVDKPGALIAEDEPLLAAALKAELARAWPQLEVLASVGDGAAAVREALRLRPDVLFLDIRMPGLSGLEAAAELLEVWDDEVGTAHDFPALVFVTAYDQYAVQAFEAQALDYLLKPVRPERLASTVDRLKARLQQRPVAAGSSPPTEGAAPEERLMAQLRALLRADRDHVAPAQRLTVIQASVGQAIHLVRLDDVQYFEAADKYVRVLTAEREYLIRTPLRELLAQLDPQQFWQIHRATVVNAAAIAQATRDDGGKLWVHLRARRERLPVSRLYAQLFRAM